MLKAKQKPVHPGEILEEEFLNPLDLSKDDLAKELNLSLQLIDDIVNQKKAITADTALRLARYFKTTADFWLGLQSEYDLQCAEDRNKKRIKKEVRPRSLHAKAA
jgi:addiction module HigA family antidote